MSTPVRRRLLSVIAALGVVLLHASPAAATHHLQTFELHHGRMTVGGVARDEPGAGIPGCPEGGTTMTTTVDDVAGTATVDLTKSYIVQNALVGMNQVDITGTGHGSYNPITHHATVTLTRSFTIRAYAGAPTCAPGAIKCAGTGHLTLTLQFSSMPVGAGGTVYANSTAGVINTVSPACPGVLGLVVRPGATLSISANPNISPPQPGAHFTLV